MTILVPLLMEATTLPKVKEDCFSFGVLITDVFFCGVSVGISITLVVLQAERKSADMARIMVKNTCLLMAENNPLRTIIRGLSYADDLT